MQALTPRQRFLKERQRKQTLTFALTTAVMTLFALVSGLVLMGVVPVPFGNSFSQPVKYASAGTIPCPPEGATPVAPESVTVQVLNTTSRQGLALTASTMLTNMGYAPLEPGNAAPEYSGTAEIDAGPAAIIDAYTVARFFPKSKVVLTESTDKTVTVLLGTFYDPAISPDELQRISQSTSAFSVPTGCLPLSDEDLAALKTSQSAQSAAQSDAQSGEAEAQSSESAAPSEETEAQPEE